MPNLTHLDLQGALIEESILQENCMPKLRKLRLEDLTFEEDVLNEFVQALTQLIELRLGFSERSLSLQGPHLSLPHSLR